MVYHFEHGASINITEIKIIQEPDVILQNSQYNMLFITVYVLRVFFHIDSY